MVKNVGNILSGAMVKNLAALRATARAVDDVQLRLASGLRVNSALDNPQNFFAARALAYRAADLGRLLDGIGQNRRAIEEAMTGIEAALKLLDQAESYVQGVEDLFLSGQIGFNPDLPYIDFGSTANLLTYAGAQDAGGVMTITDGGLGFTLDGSLWKRFAVNYTITADTVLEFDFRSTNIPEISGIGFDNDANFMNDNTRFFLYGTQTSGVNYAAPTPTFEYDGSGGWVHVTIPVGAYFTGSFSHLHFINDDDGGGDTGDTQYRNMIIHEVDLGIFNAADAGAYEDEYAAMLRQLDELVRDAHYRGLGLLTDEDMLTVFNEARSATLETDGINATSAGLGLLDIDFSSLEGVRAALTDLSGAKELLRAYASSLAIDLSIIEIRERFTLETINMLETGRDDLTLSDQNEDGASLLALQTHQAMQIIALSLAAQSPALRLFA